MAVSIGQIIQTFFPGATQGYGYGANEGFDTHAGQDFILGAGTPVRLPETGTLVWTNGYQSIFRNVDNTFTEILHVATSGLNVGQTYAAGSTIGTVSPLTGWPLTYAGAHYWSSTPHVHYAVFTSYNAAVSDAYSGSLNPISRLSSLASNATTGASKSGGSTSPVCNVPLVGGAVCDVTGAVTGTVGGIISGAGNAASGAAGAVTGIPGDIASGAAGAASGLAGGVTGAVETAAGWVGQHLIKWVILLVIAVAALIILDQLLSGGKGMQTAGTAAKLAAA